MNWCLANIAAVAEAHAEGQLVMGPLAAYIVRQMLDTHPDCADPANASRTLLWDRTQFDWSDDLLNLFAIPRSCLPASVPSRHAWGALLLAGRRIPVTVVTGDQSAALFAFGEPSSAAIYANLGTGAFLQRRLAAKDNLPGRLLASVVYRDKKRNVSVLEATINGAGSAINAICDELGMDREYMRKHSSEWLNTFSELPVFVNGISGLGSPWWLADVDSGFRGEGSPPEKIAAVIESVAFLIAVNVEALVAHAGAPEHIVVTGGLGAVDPLLQRIASLTQLPVVRARSAEATSRGLAYLLADQPKSWPDPVIESRFTPHDDAGLLARFGRWRAAMPPLPE
jgi:glycerol kinase